MADAKTIREEAASKALGETAEPQRKHSWDLNVISQDSEDPQKSFAMVGSPGVAPKKLYVGDYTPEGDAVVGFEDKGIRLLPEQQGSKEYTRYMGDKQPTSSTSEDLGALEWLKAVAPTVGDLSQGAVTSMLTEPDVMTPIKYINDRAYMDPPEFVSKSYFKQLEDTIWRGNQPKLVEYQKANPASDIGTHVIDARDLLGKELQVEPQSLQFKDYYPNFEDDQAGAEHVFFQDADGQYWEVTPGARSEDGYPQIKRADAPGEQ
jgi:hypothetical protein